MDMGDEIEIQLPTAQHLRQYFRCVMPEPQDHVAVRGPEAWNVHQIHGLVDMDNGKTNLDNTSALVVNTSRVNLVVNLLDQARTVVDALTECVSAIVGLRVNSGAS